MLVASVFSMRKKDRRAALLELREEREITRRLFVKESPVYISFFLVDGLMLGSGALLSCFVIRLFSAVFAQIGYLLLRGRTPHFVRYTWVFGCYMAGLQYIMISNHLQNSTYFSGLNLLMLTSAQLFMKSIPFFFLSSLVASLPTFLCFAFDYSIDRSTAVLGICMLFGACVRSALTSGRLRKVEIENIESKLMLQQSLRSREQEVREKANELIKRRKFESQFSPQVISDVLQNMNRYETLSLHRVSVLVCDIVDSTPKANSLEPKAYSEVVEEIFDIISAGCLKWDLTIDKFTGDGAQAFAGSPRSHPDDFARAVRAAGEILQLLSGRRDYLELRWEDPVRLRFGICEGEALVGFLGKGSTKSFTAIGANVSLAHRLCAESPPGRIIVYSLLNNKNFFDLLPLEDLHKRTREVSKVKGFEDLVFKTAELWPREQTRDAPHFGRCETCSTPLVLLENQSGIPKIICPSCSISKSGNPLTIIKSNIS